MSRMLTILIAILVLLGSFLVIRYAKDSYKTLPLDEKKSLNPPPNFQEWKEFNQTDGTFVAMFPVLPQHVTDKIPDPITNEPRKYDMYAAVSDQGTGFIISTITFPEKVKENIESILRSSVNDMLTRNKENKLKMTKLGKFFGSDSLDFSLENNEITVAGKVILKDNMLYVLSMADKTDEFNLEKLNFFINSFHIRDENNKHRKQQKLPAQKPAASKSTKEVMVKEATTQNLIRLLHSKKSVLCSLSNFLLKE